MGRNISKSILKKIIWEKSGGICAHCGKKSSGRTATIDHFIPKSTGGGYDQRNLMPLCKKCNMNKKSKDIDPEEYYSYAPEWAVQDCIDYKKEWDASRTNMFGEPC